VEKDMTKILTALAFATVLGVSAANAFAADVDQADNAAVHNGMDRTTAALPIPNQLKYVR